MIGFAELLRVIAEALGIVAKCQELRNTPEMLKAKLLQREAEAKDVETEAVKDHDEDTIRENLSE